MGPAHGPRGTGATVLRGLDFVADAATGALFLIGAVAMFVMVVTRYGFAYSDPSVEIIARYFMIWGTFIGMSSAVRFGVNIRFALVEHFLGGTGRRVFLTLGYGLTLALALGLCLSGYALAEETKMFGEVIPTALRLKVWPFHAAIGIGGLFLSIQTIRAAVNLWRDGPDTTGAPDGAAGV